MYTRETRIVFYRVIIFQSHFHLFTFTSQSSIDLDLQIYRYRSCKHAKDLIRAPNVLRELSYDSVVHVGEIIVFFSLDSKS